MTPKLPAEFTDQELLEEAKKNKTGSIINAVLFGVMIGIATYSTVTNGLGILTFFPLLFIPMLTKNRARQKALNEEVIHRNLK